MEKACGIQVRYKILFRNCELKRPFEGSPWNGNGFLIEVITVHYSYFSARPWTVRTLELHVK